MTIVFTICSNNYLAQAKTFVDSLICFNPSVKPYIFLIDKKSSLIDYSFFAPAEVVEVSNEIFLGFDKLIKKYGIVELNTAVKPFVFEYLADKNKGLKRLYYFDPDICVYDKLDLLDELLNDADIVATPHFLSPLPPDGAEPFENMALNYGTYNLGFLALNPDTSNTRNFLKWWGERTAEFGYSKVDYGFFVDQLWINLVPIFYDRFCTLKHPGFNMAPWNLHERKVISYDPDGRVKINDDKYLAFFHFSSYSFSKPDLLSTKYNRYTFENTPDIKKLFEDYHNTVFNNKMDTFKKIECTLPLKKNKIHPIKRKLYPYVQRLKKMWQ